jgi:hypothetical protein
MKLIIYTALFADESLPLSEVGNFFPFEHDKGNVEYIAFTNRKDLTSGFWDVRYVQLTESSPRVDARFYKLNSHIVLPEHDYSIWMDSQCYFVYQPEAIVDMYLDKQNSDIAIHHHSDINSLASESVAQAWVYKNDNPSIVMNQVIRYGEEGFPMLRYDHYSTGILLRRNNKNVQRFNSLWWSEVFNYSLRDQLSVPYVVWKCRGEGIQIHTIMEDFTAHKNALPIPKSKIFFTTPKPPLRENINDRQFKP